MGSLPEALSQQILLGISLGGRLGVVQARRGNWGSPESGEGGEASAKATTESEEEGTLPPQVLRQAPNRHAQQFGGTTCLTLLVQLMRHLSLYAFFAASRINVIYSIIRNF